MKKTTFLKSVFDRHPENEEAYDYNLLPEDFLATSKIPIKCVKHGIFHQTANSHYGGTGCPTCGALKTIAAKTLTTEEMIFRSKAKFGDKFSYEKTVYVSKDSNVILKCPSHGYFTMTMHNHLVLKYGCPKCGYEIPRSKRLHGLLEKAKRIHGNRFDYSKVTVGNLMDKMEIVCPVHGSFWQSLYNHATVGDTCPDCARDTFRVPFDEFLKRAQAVHGDFYGYNKVSYSTLHEGITITCPLHGDFVQRANSHLAGCKCKKCFQDKNKLSREEFIRNARAVHGNKYDYSKVVYDGNKKPVEIFCKRHGMFWIRPNSHVSAKQGCHRCRESRGETEVSMLLEKWGFNHAREYTVKPHKFRFDFYLPEFNIFIEFNGHQHYIPVDTFGGYNTLVETRQRDEKKKRLVEEIGGYLIVLTYQHLGDGTLEKALISKLRKKYRIWCKVDDKPLAFKSVLDVYRHFNISNTVHTKNLADEIGKNVRSFSVLFGTL